jgi:hypothetical protein
MFRLAADVQVYLHREAIDFRVGINGLAILVEQAMHLDRARSVRLLQPAPRPDPAFAVRPLRVLADDEAARG